MIVLLLCFGIYKNNHTKMKLHSDCSLLSFGKYENNRMTSL